MKKLLIFLLTLLLVAAGVFFWKGGHHALFLAEQLEEWADADTADQSLTVQISELTFSADTFWTEYADRRIFGLTAGGCSAYLLDHTLYMDTGKAYSLPESNPETKQLKDIVTGLLLYGRVTKSGNVYELTMEREELAVRTSVALDRGISSMTLNADFTMDGAPVHLLATLTPKETVSHPIPQAVSDAIVRASMVPPMPLREPLEVLFPALQDLSRLSADVTLGVSCGILNLSETIGLQIGDGRATLTRAGVQVDIALPSEFEDISPAAAGLLLLRNGDFTRTGDDAAFTVRLPAEATTELVSALVPQTEDLGIRFPESTAVLTIHGTRLAAISLRAEGAVPFLVTQIPVSFSAEFDIH